MVDYHSSGQCTGWNTSEGRPFLPMNRIYLGDELERPCKNRLSSDFAFSPTDFDQEQRFFSNSTLPSVMVTEFDM